MRLLIALFFAALIALQLRLWLSEDGLQERWALETALAEQSARNASLAERNSALEAEVRDLRQGTAAAEERARSELGMVGPEETFYQIVSFSEE